MQIVSRKTSFLPFINLFTSIGTLICCALPAMLVTIGAGATLAGLVSTVPQLIWFSKYKGTVFLVAGILILITSIYQWRNKNAPCPSEPEQAKVCNRIRKINSVVYIFSVVLYSVGFFFAFLVTRMFV